MMKWSWSWFAGLAACLLLLASCQRTALESAVSGSLLPTEENVVVTSHCQGCHVHAKLREAPHIEAQKARYAADSPMRAATRCLECHIVSPETMFSEEARATRFPHGALVEIATIPEPQPGAALPGKPDLPPAPPEEQEGEGKNKRRWYFLYLF